ncbi:MAG: sensor histidine kinase [Anaerolineales bacterium]
MFRSLQSWLWLTYALIIGIVLGFSALMGMVILRNAPIRNTNVRLQELIILTERQGRLENLNPTRLPAILRQIDEQLDVRVAILDLDGVPALDSRGGALPPIPQIRIPPLEHFVGRRPPTGSFRDADKKVWLYTLRPFDRGRFLLLAAPRPGLRWLEIFRDDLLPPLAQVGGIAVVLAVILSILMARWIAAPLKRMAQAARAISVGQYRPILLEGPNEVQQLAQAFNEMVERVQASQQSQRDFVANVSHELKTPLTSIQGFAQAMLDGTVDNPQGIRQAAGVIYNEAGHMHRMVVDLLDLARLDSGTAGFQRAPVDLIALLRRIVEKFATQATQSRVNLASELQPLPVLIGDGDRLTQVFTNLVDNALKHTPAGGRVAVRARQVGDKVEISVADTGPGIPREEHKRIFERFYQLDKSRAGGRGRGAGLGLAIAHEIVQAHGGHISAQSEPGQGSSFVVKLPLVQPDDSTLVARKSRRKGDW